jgi:hypothetical protein
MTPKEKAEELVDKYSNLQEKIEWGNDELKQNAGLIYEENNVEYDKYYYELAKQCALIAVDEIIKNDKENYGTDGFVVNYWEEVKKEIEKL